MNALYSVLDNALKILFIAVTLSLSSCDFKHKDMSAIKKPMTGTVILLNGTSSSGKTTIINELEKYGGMYKILSYDTFVRTFDPLYIKTHPEQIKEWEELEKVSAVDKKAKQKLDKLTEKYNRKCFDDFYALIKDEALKDKNIVVDTIVDDAEFGKLSRILGTIKVINVLLYCPLDIALSRVKQRNLTGIKEEQRDVFQPIGQYELIYKPQENISEKVVDTISSKDLKQLLRTAIDEYLKTLPEKLKNQAVEIAESLEGHYKGFVRHFKLDELGEIAIVPIRPYDLILHCTKNPQVLAQELSSCIDGSK